jgi:outer membrane protein assembly factor BamB
METLPSTESAARPAGRVAAWLCCAVAVLVLAAEARAADRERDGAPDRSRAAIAYRRCAARLRAVAPGSRPTAALRGCTAPGAGAYAPGWSAVHADASNTDATPLPGARDLTLAWQRRLPGGINLGPTIDPAGRVYVTHNADDAGCHLHALDGRTGDEVWCSAEVDRFAVASSPLLDRDGRLFVADSEAMHAFDRDGRLLWKTPIVGVPLSAQFTPEGRLLFMTHVGVIYVLRRETGEALLPPHELIPGAAWTPADGMNACLIGTPRCPAANTLAVDRTGRFFFTFWTPGAPQAGVRAMRYVERPVPALVNLWANDSLPGGSASSPDVSADGTRLYVTDNVDAVHALDADSGETVWTHRIGFAPGGSPSLSPDGLLMPSGSRNGVVLALRDEGTHATLAWRRDDLVNRGIPTQAKGGIAYPTVSRGGLENDLVVIDTTTGEVLDREPLPGTTAFSVGTTVGPDGTVYVPTFLGQLFAFRPQE